MLQQYYLNFSKIWHVLIGSTPPSYLSNYTITNFEKLNNEFINSLNETISYLNDELSLNDELKNRLIEILKNIIIKEFIESINNQILKRAIIVFLKHIKEKYKISQDFDEENLLSFLSYINENELTSEEKTILDLIKESIRNLL